MFLEAGLVPVEAVVAVGRGGGAPLAESVQFLREVEFLAAFGFDEPHGAVGGADKEGEV